MKRLGEARHGTARRGPSKARVQSTFSTQSVLMKRRGAAGRGMARHGTS